MGRRAKRPPSRLHGSNECWLWDGMPYRHANSTCFMPRPQIVRLNPPNHKGLAAEQSFNKTCRVVSALSEHKIQLTFAVNFLWNLCPFVRKPSWTAYQRNVLMRCGPLYFQTKSHTLSLGFQNWFPLSKQEQADLRENFCQRVTKKSRWRWPLSGEGANGYNCIMMVKLSTQISNQNLTFCPFPTTQNLLFITNSRASLTCHHEWDAPPEFLI